MKKSLFALLFIVLIVPFVFAMAPQPEPSALMNFLPFISLCLIVYFFVKKRRKKRDEINNRKFYSDHSVAEEKMDFCGNCGKKIEEDENFCSGCGNVVGTSSNKSITPVYMQKPMFESSKPVMNRTTLRILSKVGLILVVIGFCMPVACNMNGFQIAEFGMNFASGFDSNNPSGINPLSLALYGIFAFSCLGGILLLSLVMKRAISMGWDWFAVTGTAVSTIVVIYRFNLGHFDWGMLQSGAYFILIGLIMSFVFLCLAHGKEEH